MGKNDDFLIETERAADLWFRKCEKLEESMASLADHLNTTLRENYGDKDQVKTWTDDMRPAIDALVVGARYGMRYELRHKLESAEARIVAIQESFNRADGNYLKAKARVAELEAANARLREAIDALRECNICHGQRVFMDRDSLGEMRPRGCWCAAMKESKIKSNPTSSGVQNERTEAVSKKPSAAGGHIIQQKRSLK